MAAYISFQPSDYYNTKLYTGTGSSNAITGVGFQPDFTWIKNRDDTDWHILTDAVRGVTKQVFSNETNAEATQANNINSFDSDGFTVGTEGQVNFNTEDFASWNWKAGTTSGIATNGSTTITPTGYSFNQTSGFSTIAYTGNSTSGAKIPHGLGVAPDLMFVKKLNAGQSWAVYSKSIGPTKYLSLNQTIGAATATDRWNDTATDSVNFTVGDAGDTNGAFNYIAYCFASKKGFSKFGYYGGLGNADGPFIYTGFRPAFVLIKKYNAGGDSWFISDSKRDPYNVVEKILYPDDYWLEGSGIFLDFLSNGFKLRTSSSSWNGNGSSYIYAAFAEFPLVSSNSKAGTAR